MPMIAAFKVTVDPTKIVDKLNNAMRNRVIRIALNKASVPVKQTVISLVPSDTGALKKSMRIKVTNKRNSGLWVAVIGATISYKRMKKGKKIFPAHYQTIVDKGSKKMVAHPFMRPAANSSRLKIILTMTELIKSQVAQILSQRRIDTVVN